MHCLRVLPDDRAVAFVVAGRREPEGLQHRNDRSNGGGRRWRGRAQLCRWRAGGAADPAAGLAIADAPMCCTSCPALTLANRLLFNRL